jgi:hypothetical protein
MTLPARGLVGAPDSHIPLLTMTERFHHHVYVVLLDGAVLLEPRVLLANLRRDPAKPCVYVGMTGILPIKLALMIRQIRLYCVRIDMGNAV